MSGSPRAVPTTGQVNAERRRAADKPAAPSGRAAFRAEGTGRTAVRVYNYGEDERIANPGDLLLTALIGDGVESRLEVAVVVHGRDIAQLQRKVARAVMEYNENRDWLTGSVSRELTDDEVLERHPHTDYAAMIRERRAAGY